MDFKCLQSNGEYNITVVSACAIVAYWYRCSPLNEKDVSNTCSRQRLTGLLFLEGITNFEGFCLTESSNTVNTYKVYVYDGY